MPFEHIRRTLGTPLNKLSPNNKEKFEFQNISAALSKLSLNESAHSKMQDIVKWPDSIAERARFELNKGSIKLDEANSIVEPIKEKR